MPASALSSNAIIYAILSLNSEIDLQKGYLESSDIPSDERDNEEEMLNDLEQAFMEFVDYYKDYRRNDSSLPSIDDLLTSTL